MVDTGVVGTDWSSSELDLIVADYFSMLNEEQAGVPYNKTEHRKALMAQIRRSSGSIEYKHQNISAVLMQLGLPRIAGYLPAWNFQGAIVDAIGRYLTKDPEPVPFVAPAVTGLGDASLLFEEEPPKPIAIRPAAAEAFNRVVQKFDPALRDQLNRSLGLAGERHVYEHEQLRLRQMDRADLARKVKWVSQVDGDGAGYDIRSFDERGKERLIEVKTTRGGSTTPFYLTRNENDVAHEKPRAFRLYRIYEFSKQPKLFTLSPPFDAVLQLEPLTFRASLK